MDTPLSLKRSDPARPGLGSDAGPSIPALELLEQTPGVFEVGLRGDHLHAITQAGAHSAESLHDALASLGVTTLIEPADPTLEDVFVALTRTGVDLAAQ